MKATNPNIHIVLGSRNHDDAMEPVKLGLQIDVYKFSDKLYH